MLEGTSKYCLKMLAQVLKCLPHVWSYNEDGIAQGILGYQCYYTLLQVLVQIWVEK